MNSPDLISNTKENQQQSKSKTLISKKGDFDTDIIDDDAFINESSTSPPSFVVPELKPAYKISPNVHVLKLNNQIKELHTVLHDKRTSHSDFKFYGDRLVSDYCHHHYTFII
jgi:hypothetical protein